MPSLGPGSDPDGNGGGGEFTTPWRLLAGEHCPRCPSVHVEGRCWESDDGEHEDFQHRCVACDHRWWTEGPDA